MTNLDTFQRAVARALAVLAVLHVPILASICWLLDRDVLANGMAALTLAAVPIAFMLTGRSVTAIASALTVALVGQTSLLIYAFSGHPWQVEMHFYYFAVLAQLSQLGEKSQQYQRGHSESLHYTALAGARAALPGAVMRGGGCGGRSSLS
jgi:methyl-accepting chemotaxis protein